MPTPYLEKVAKDKGKPISEMEDLWNKAKAQAAKEGHAKDYAYITGIFKKMADVTVRSDYESIPPSNLGPLDSKTADPNNFDSQGNPIMIQKLKAYARIDSNTEVAGGSAVDSVRNSNIKLGKLTVKRLAGSNFQAKYTWQVNESREGALSKLKKLFGSPKPSDASSGISTWIMPGYRVSLDPQGSSTGFVILVYSKQAPLLIKS